MKTVQGTIEPLESRIAPSVFVVSTLADSGSHSLRAEIVAANANASGGDTIIFQHDVHGKTVPLTGTIKLLSNLPQITDGVAIVGPIPGKSNGITINGNKHAIINFGNTVSYAGISDLTITNGQAQYGGGVYIKDQAYAVTITDCTITGNHAVGPKVGNGGYGGGINIVDSPLVTITNSKITGNTAAGAIGNEFSTGGFAAGGGIISNSSTLEVVNSLISGNTATGGRGGALAHDTGGQAAGGGVIGYSSTITIEGSVISGNKAIGGNGGSAGNGSPGMAGSPGMNGAGGSAGGNGGAGGNADGGGIRSIYTGSLTITNSTISGNTAQAGNGGAAGNGGKGGAGGSGAGEPHPGKGGDGGPGGIGGSAGTAFGGGVQSYAAGQTATLSIQSSTVSGNKTIPGKPAAGGKGGPAGAGSYTLAGVLHRGAAGGKGAAGSTASGEGGGIWAGKFLNTGSDTVSLVQLTIAQNTATYGGGVFLELAAATIDNCTISQNKAAMDGGGLTAEGGTVGVVSTIIAGNTALLDPDVNATINDSYDLIGRVTNGTGLNNGGTNDVLNMNPLLGPLGFHDGGKTETMLLSFLSPAIGAGSNPDALGTDQNGNPREINGLTDIGAVEEG
jgi:hypothetical protein